mmetsp:Transcript_18520/g.37280  ORF Transcript_18520/g.37280 Transcript_18520/m.37280 type:complete len:236 (+) Transcript_18520:220-927(+)
MFQDALNSAELAQIQNFLDAFMSPTSTFKTNYIGNKDMNSHITVGGSNPNEFAHYLLGVLIMFPDLLFIMTESRVMSSPNDPAARVIMNIRCCGTKLYNLKLEDWMPHLFSVSKVDSTVPVDQIILAGSPTGRNMITNKSSNSKLEQRYSTKFSHADTDEHPRKRCKHKHEPTGPVESEFPSTSKVTVSETYIKHLVSRTTPAIGTPYIELCGTIVFCLEESNIIKHVQIDLGSE